MIATYTNSFTNVSFEMKNNTDQMSMRTYLTFMVDMNIFIAYRNFRYRLMQINLGYNIVSCLQYILGLTFLINFTCEMFLGN